MNASCVQNLHHHHMSMGGWSWAFTPYRNEDVARYLNHPRVQTFIVQDIDAICKFPIFCTQFQRHGLHNVLQCIPFLFAAYNERLTMPKMLILGGNDQFFPSTGSHYFFDELNEPKFMWYVHMVFSCCSRRSVQLFITPTLKFSTACMKMMTMDWVTTKMKLIEILKLSLLLPEQLSVLFYWW